MSILFKKGKIGNLTLKNRFVRSATAELLASDDCRVTDQYINAFSRLAKGGVGLIITGNYYVNNIGRSIPRTIIVDKDEIINDLKRVTAVVHENGGKVIAQINHGGRQCNPEIIKETPVAPSQVRDPVSFVKPREMLEIEIEDTINDFAKAAGRIKKAGFDGVQVHAAHGYLVNQFLSGHTKRRKDKWGGSIDNRMRFLVEIYKEIRLVVGPEFPVLIKINSEDFVSGGLTLNEAVLVCKKLDELGINAIEVSGGTPEKGMVTIRGDIPRDLLMRNRSFFERILIRLFEKSIRKHSLFEEAYFLQQAAIIKKEVTAPIITVGGIRNRAVMEDALNSGKADFISMCRPFIRHPNLVNLMEKNEKNPITCTNCNMCTF